MFEVLGLRQFQTDIDAWLAAVELEAAAVARGMAVQAFDMMLRISPQYSGDFVANWNVSVDSSDTSFSEFRPHADARRAPSIGGDQQAQGEARRRNTGKAADFSIGQTIFITNASQHRGEYYAGMIENNQIKFRPGNAGAVIANTVATLMSSSKNLTRGEAAAFAQGRF